MTRLYREGRTETVRSCTNETSAFVKAMESGADKETLKGLAKAAAKYHVGLYQVRIKQIIIYDSKKFKSLMIFLTPVTISET